MRNYIRNQIKASCRVKERLLADSRTMQTIVAISRKAINVYRAKNKILIAGNGGSAADAQHIAGELVSRFYFDRPGLPAIALTTDTSILTAIGNDYGYEHLFARQVQANGVAGDMFIGISTSGNSPNILKALDVCKEMQVTSVGLCGASGKMTNRCDYCVKVPSNETPRIQESHILIGHIICAVIEEELFGTGFQVDS